MGIPTFVTKYYGKNRGQGVNLLLLRNVKNFSAIALLFHFLMSISRKYSNKQ